MVVVFVTHNYPRHPGDLSGAFLHPLACALRDRGHDLRVVAPADRGRAGRDPLDGIPVRRVAYSRPEWETLAYEGRMEEQVRRPAGLLAFLGLLRALRLGALAEAADSTGRVVLHAHWWVPAGLALPDQWTGIITLHGTDARILERSRLARWLGSRVLRRAALVSAVSPEVAAVADRVSGREDAVRHVQPMPVDSGSRPWSSGGGGALVVARLFPQKRVELAIAAVGEVARDGQPLVLTIVGDGPERPALEALAASRNRRATIRFTGQLSPGAVTERLATADVLLFPSVAEGLGLAALEALMTGVPVVACRDGGGVVSALERFGGAVVTEPEARALAAGLRQALAPAKRAEARRAGEAWRAELSPARVAARFEGWYEEALGA